MKELLFGAAYYDEYMPYDRLQQDVAMMKKAGINTVRIAESTWSTCEPQEGVFDFSHVELSLIHISGCLTNVGTVSAAEPTEITFWHYMSEDKEGKFVNEAIEEFNNSQDEVHVTAQYLPREELMKQYTIGVVSGELPDLSLIHI